MLLPFMLRDVAEGSAVGLVEAFLDQVPKGDGNTPCRLLWLAFQYLHPDAVESEDAFAEECRRLGRTKTVYGRENLINVDESGVRKWFVSLFD